MSNGYNFGQAGTITPEEFAQQQTLNRQQQMAQMLMQQGQQAPQGQMISGRYVPPSIFQNLAGLANIVASKYIGEKADTEAVKLANAIRENKADVEQQIINKMTPQAGSVQEMAGPYGISGAGQNVPMPVAVKPGREADYSGALKMIQMNPYGAGKEYVPTILKQLSPELTPEERRYKAAIADGSFKGGFNAFLNQMSDKDRASIENDKQRLRFEAARVGIAQQQLAYDTGIGMPGMGGGQVSVSGQSSANNQFAPKTMPQYEYNPSLSPKQNQEQAGKFAEKQLANVSNAKDSFDLMQQAGAILSTGAPSSGLLSNAVTVAGEAFNLPFGARKQESEADAQLKMLSGALTMKQPRFEGPQGVLDVTLYQKLAGDLGNANIPVESRLATMKRMVDLQKKYYPGGDWDSIETSLKNSGKVSLTPVQYAINPQTGERRMSNDGGKTWTPAR
jgi:hypothetical protein